MINLGAKNGPVGWNGLKYLAIPSRRGDCGSNLRKYKPERISAPCMPRVADVRGKKMNPTRLESREANFLLSAAAAPNVSESCFFHSGGATERETVTKVCNACALLKIEKNRR